MSLILFTAALAFDVALFPFNLWAPDVYEGSPGNITALLAGVNKKSAFAALMLIAFTVFAAQSALFSMIFMLLSIATMFFGNIVALVQNDVKRMLSYSSISQAGYIMIGLSAATQFGVESSLVQIFAHSFMIIGSFAIVLWLESLNIKTISDYSGLNGRNRFAALALTLLMLSMAGIPTTARIHGQIPALLQRDRRQPGVAWGVGHREQLPLDLLLRRVINSMYLPRKHSKIKLDKFVFAVALIALIIILILGIYPQPLLSAAARSKVHNARMNYPLPSLSISTALFT